MNFVHFAWINRKSVIEGHQCFIIYFAINLSFSTTMLVSLRLAESYDKIFEIFSHNCFGQFN